MKSLPDKIPSLFRPSMLKDLACVYPGRTDHVIDYLIVKLVVILISIILFTVFLISGTNIFVWMFIFVLLLISHDLEIRRRSEEIRRIRAIEFPGFLGLLETLIVCGSSVPSAINKCSVIFSGNKSLLADELSTLASGILSGKPVEFALEQFAAKLNISEISSALLLIARYHSSGNIDTLSLLSLHKSSCYDFARSAARKHADSVSLKLLLPMMLQFVNVALISVLPSLISSGII
jgi:Flp pilus assembly protein TadB